MKTNLYPTVSVIMSTFKENSEFLKDSVKSILEQTFVDFELIIVLDGDQQCIDLIESFADERIVLLNNKENQGLSFSLNRAIEVSRGEFIFRMDSDDISCIDRIEIQLSAFRESIDIISTRAFLIDLEYKIIGLSGPSFFSNLLNQSLLYLTTNFNPVIHPSVAARREIFSNNLYREDIKFGQDYELWRRLKRNGHKIFFLKERLIFYREKKNLLKKIYQKKIMENQRY